ncbi:MAG: CPBP family intramembrane metalloprotease [Myxococcales bacterium]|nr:CPBP family intramembrane metalloprotease [Myxococcales bacterium]
MIGPPAFPSQPPPAPPAKEQATRPMTGFGAALWVSLATLAFMWLAALLVSLREETMRDQAVLVMCQAAAYLLVLFGILRVHAPEQSIRAFVGLRATHPGFYPLALVMGAAGAVPATWLLMRLDQYFPKDAAQTFNFSDLFYEATMSRRIAMAVAIVIVGPVIEELFFRGAILGPLARRQRSVAAIAMSALLFAFVHPEPRSMPPIFLMGLLLGYLRASTGSILPSIAMHVGFNLVPFIELFSEASAPPHVEGESIPLWLLLTGTAITLVTLALTVLVAKQSRAADQARTLDRA